MDDYHLLNQIGEGSFGKVYKARRKYTGRLVAIKMINKLGQSKEDLQSFRREISILQKVDHPNIMRMLEIFETNTDFCLVTELGRGDLFQIITDNQSLPENILRSISAQLVSALNYLHSQRIIHRDLKPQNVLISSNGTIKICDFGFARVLSNTTLALNSIKGTPLYMAPELVQEHQYNEKVDIWSIGIILYELYYGRTPFFTNSFYKLIQMIVNDSITWPGPISDDFKDFLSSMLQKDPEMRASCADLLGMRFIRGIELDYGTDEFYMEKKTQFEEAIQESLSDMASEPFKPPKSDTPDFQSIYVNPSAYSSNDLSMAAKHLYTSNALTDSPLAESFAYHFKEFISKPEAVEEALIAATYLLKRDSKKYLSSFNPAYELLGMIDMPKSSIEFFTHFLLIPYAKNVFEAGSTTVPEILLDSDRAERLKDKLLSFLFISNNESIMMTFSLMSYMMRASKEFRNVLSNAFSSQVIPIITSHVTHSNSSVVSTAGITILMTILDENSNAFQFIHPASEFIKVIETILKHPPESVCEFSKFAATLTIIKTSISILGTVPEFQNLVGKKEFLQSASSFITRFYSMYKESRKKILNSLFVHGSSIPSNEEEYLAYACLINSPFELFLLTSEDIDSCVQNFKKLLSVHLPELVRSLTSLNEEVILPHYGKLIPFFSKQDCIDVMSEFTMRVIKDGSNNGIYKILKNNDIIPTLCQSISSFQDNTPFHLKALITCIILSYKKKSELLLKNCNLILETLYHYKATAEAATIITAHLARLDEAFLENIEKCKGLDYIKYMIKMNDDNIKSRALSFVGCYCKWRAFTEEYTFEILPSILTAFSEPQVECRRFAAHAIGNILYRSPYTASSIAARIDDIKNAIECDDQKTVEYTCYIVCNLISASDQFLQKLIESNLARKVIDQLKNDELSVKIIKRIPAFCKYDESRNFLKQRGIRSSIYKMSTQSKDPEAREIASQIIKCLDC